ncbi:uracil phosphoribosyltransferase-domain-containing protein [Syncephalis pseudoplumigaleata]|uniref:Uridine kinase n=1 Tax=Syncephalis pseudoplumigaleata TaxID=1712513 RepID=A0A4P9Z2W4_9FUNG|nr:uracil phosphoribosyltransferase-domain-containing protein [Syncephalis pseudoplumigaleata]|eukprot:RKP26725.1 uracil phosphoribosyltransferase-domain-containing protein [Syncephalis pseudoplumigaleata]
MLVRRADGQNCDCYVIGVAGGSASGKTSVSRRIIQMLNVPWVIIVSMDSFYNALTPEQSAPANRATSSMHNFDHPDAFDYEVMVECVRKLRQGKSVEIPVYDFSTHSRLNKTQTVYGANVIIVEGIFTLYDQKLMDLMDLKVIFVDTDADVRLARRMKRDICERSRELRGVIEQYERFVKPMYDQYVHPTIHNADVIIPRGLDNHIAIDLIAKHVQRQLKERRFAFRWTLARGCSDLNSLPDSVIILKQTSQLKAIHTIIRDCETDRDDFIFYSERLANLVVEHGLSLLPFESTTVTTPVNQLFHGKQGYHKLCGVSIIRAGLPMEVSLRKVVKDVPLGRMLIQSDSKTGEPQVHAQCGDERPWQAPTSDIDATIATGAAGIMAIRVLLDHDVPEDRIIFLSLLSAPQGLHSIAKAFPKVRIVTSMVDPGLSDNLYIEPGMGNFGGE